MPADRDGDRLISLFRTDFPLEAELLAGVLLEHGVPAMARATEMATGIQRAFAPDLALAETCIYRRDLDHALEVLEEFGDEVAQLVEPTVHEPSEDDLEDEPRKPGGFLGVVGAVSLSLYAVVVLLLLPLILVVGLVILAMRLARRMSRRQVAIAIYIAAVLGVGALYWWFRQYPLPVFPARAMTAYLEPRNVAMRKQAYSLAQGNIHDDDQAASDLLYKAADKGDVIAWMAWARFQHSWRKNHDFRPPFYFSALVYQPVKEIADKGNAEAQSALSRWLATYEPDRKEDIFKYCKESAEGGFERAMLSLTRMYWAGKEFCLTDKDAAVSWAEKAVGTGGPAAMSLLGSYLLQSDYKGHDFKRGFDLEEQAADAGYRSAFFTLGWCYEHGRGTTANKDQALKIYDAGAQDGDKYCARALYALAWRLLDADYSGRDYKRGFELVRHSAEGGYALAYDALGYCYEVGVGTQVDGNQAVKAYEAGAKLNNAGCIYELGRVYWNGDIVPRNDARALRYIDRAAKLGDKDALGFYDRHPDYLGHISYEMTEMNLRANMGN